MVTIIIENSYSRLDNTSAKIDQELHNLLSYEKTSQIFWKIKNKNRFWIDSRKRLYSLKTKKFPTGLVSHVIKHFESLKIDYKVSDKRLKPEQMHYWRWKTTPPNLRPYQQEAINKLCEQGRGTLELATGTGKTLILQHLIKNLGVSTLVVVPSLNILNQTYALFKLYFGAKEVQTIHQLKRQKKIKPIVIANIQSVIKQDDAFFKHFQHLAVDECHHGSAASYTHLNKKQLTHLYYRTFLSATPYRNDNSDLELFGLIGDIIYSYPAMQAIKEKILVPPYFYIKQINNKSITCKDYFEEYEHFIVNNKERNKQITSFAKKLASKDHQVLIIVEQIKHGETLHKMLPDSIYINGQQPNAYNKEMLERFNLNKFSILIATSVVGEGIDLPAVEVLINAAGGKAESEVIQRVGRVLRIAPGKEKAMVIDFIDAQTQWLAQHAQIRLRYYQTYGTQINFIE